MVRAGLQAGRVVLVGSLVVLPLLGHSCVCEVVRAEAAASSHTINNTISRDESGEPHVRAPPMRRRLLMGILCACGSLGDRASA